MPSIRPKVHAVQTRKGGPECVGHVLWEVLNDYTHRGRTRPELMRISLNERTRSPRPSVSLRFRLELESGFPSRLFGLRLIVKPFFAESDGLLSRVRDGVKLLLKSLIRVDQPGLDSPADGLVRFLILVGVASHVFDEFARLRLRDSSCKREGKHRC